MKKIFSLVLILIMALAFSACDDKENEKVTKDNKKHETVTSAKDEKIDKEVVTEKNTENKNDKLEENKKDEDPDKNTSENNDKVNDKNNPEKDKNENKKDPVKEDNKPNKTEQSNQENKPSDKNESKPEENKPDNSNKSVGKQLLDEFNSYAGSGNAITIAGKLEQSNTLNAYAMTSQSVSPGLLTGFGNNEIKGFSEGAKFEPIIGTIPFVGYVFVLEDGTDASAFISTLKSSANLNWNVCSTADEMVAGSAGNKVFFVMCPTKIEE